MLQIVFPDRRHNFQRRTASGFLQHAGSGRYSEQRCDLLHKAEHGIFTAIVSESEILPRNQPKSPGLIRSKSASRSTNT